MNKSVVSEILHEPAVDNNDTHLWMAVMDRAVRDLVALERYRQDPAVMEDPVFRYDYRTLRKWFHSSSMEPGSFNWICSLVNIDPKWALNRLEDRLKVCIGPSSRRNAGQNKAQPILPVDEDEDEELGGDIAEAA
ncbi:MAG: hypothetical protein HQL96_02590 [Magnetococcales bacterium]|nr:hypothetical protein [Magnetococcales bacterium]